MIKRENFMTESGTFRRKTNNIFNIEKFNCLRIKGEYADCSRRGAELQTHKN